jgi:hypothetical protein
VIQCLARGPPTPSRLRASRMVSMLTWLIVNPCSKQTSAANSRVQRLVFLPNVRGLWCNRDRKASHLTWSNCACTVFGREDSCLRHSKPLCSKAWIALRTVWVAQPKLRAISLGRCSRLDASRIWLRRRLKASDERSPAVSPCLLGWTQGSDIHGGFHTLRDRFLTF